MAKEPLTVDLGALSGGPTTAEITLNFTDEGGAPYSRTYSGYVSDDNLPYVVELRSAGLLTELFGARKRRYELIDRVAEAERSKRGDEAAGLYGQIAQVTADIATTGAAVLSVILPGIREPEAQKLAADTEKILLILQHLEFVRAPTVAAEGEAEGASSDGAEIPKESTEAP